MPKSYFEYIPKGEGSITEIPIDQISVGKPGGYNYEKDGVSTVIHGGTGINASKDTVFASEKYVGFLISAEDESDARGYIDMINTAAKTAFEEPGFDRALFSVLDKEEKKTFYINLGIRAAKSVKGLIGAKGLLAAELVKKLEKMNMDVAVEPASSPVKKKRRDEEGPPVKKRRAIMKDPFTSSDEEDEEPKKEDEEPKKEDEEPKKVEEKEPKKVEEKEPKKVEETEPKKVVIEEESSAEDEDVVSDLFVSEDEETKKKRKESKKKRDASKKKRERSDEIDILAPLNKKFKDETRSVTALTKTVVELTDEVERLKKLGLSVGSMRKSIQTKDAEIATHVGTIANLRKAYGKILAEAKETEETLEKAQAMIEAAQGLEKSMIADHNAKIDALEAELRQLREAAAASAEFVVETAAIEEEIRESTQSWGDISVSEVVNFETTDLANAIIGALTNSSLTLRQISYLPVSLGEMLHGEKAKMLWIAYRNFVSP